MHETIPKKRLLVIDDDALIRDLIVMLANMSGFKCLEAGDFESAERILGQSHPDVIVLDLCMPGRDGIEWISELARRNCSARLILQSGFDRRLLESAAFLASNLNLTVLGILEKPFHPEDVFDLLDHEMPLRGAQAAELAISLDELQTAIHGGQLTVFFQPQIRLSDGEWVGLEALVRWNHPQHGLLPPKAFVSQAESSGLGHALTTEVVRLALAGYAEITYQTRYRGSLAINLPGTALVDSNFPEQVLVQAYASGCDHRNLVFELSETGMAQDVNVAAEILMRLRLMGFSLSIDDFGTGYSSFEMLHKLPFNQLKIEVEFVQAAQTNKSARAIVENSVALARRLGITSVAEGVETQAELDWLRELGCDCAQGFFISRPVPAHRLVNWFRRWRYQPDSPQEFTANNPAPNGHPRTLRVLPGLSGLMTRDGM